MRTPARRRLACFVAASALVASAALASTMKQLAAALPIPKDTEPIELTNLFYRTAAWRGEVRSVRLDGIPKPGAEEVKWVLATSNTRGSRMRIDIELHLLDAAGERVASAKKTLLVPAGTTEAKDLVKIKLAAGDWERAQELRIVARFMSN